MKENLAKNSSSLLKVLFTSVRPYFDENWWNLSSSPSECQDIIDTFEYIMPSWTQLGEAGIDWSKHLCFNINLLKLDILELAFSISSYQTTREGVEKVTIVENYIIQALKVFGQATTRTLLTYVQQFDPTVHGNLGSLLIKMTVSRKIKPKDGLYWVLY